MTRPIELSREARQAASVGLREVLAEDMDEALYGLRRQTDLR